MLVAVQTLHAQGRRNEKKILTYETIYDAPYELNKLWIGFQPIYTELFVTNVNMGFGLDVTYMHKDKFSIQANFRKPYARQLDHQQNLAYKNGEGLDNLPTLFSYMQAGGTYHIKDWEEDTETFIYLYSKRYSKGNRWASMVPDKSQIQAKTRKIIGARAGAFTYKTTVTLDQILESRDLQLQDAEGNVLDYEAIGVTPFSSLNVAGGYIGGSYSWIKNMAIDPDHSYADLVKDLIFTAYLDILIGKPDLSDVQYQGVAFATDVIETGMFGVRAGMEGRFNRALSWAYGGEIGYRPGLKGRGFYGLIKITFPMYSTDLDNRVEAFSK